MPADSGGCRAGRRPNVGGSVTLEVVLSPGRPAFGIRIHAGRIPKLQAPRQPSRPAPSKKGVGRRGGLDRDGLVASSGRAGLVT